MSIEDANFYAWLCIVLCTIKSQMDQYWTKNLKEIIKMWSLINMGILSLVKIILSSVWNTNKSTKCDLVSQYRKLNSHL